jgi:tyrosyl-tRNA synthetase
MGNILEMLRERGFIENTTHDQELQEYLSSGCATCYIGFDPTASSLHVGHLIPIMSLVHMQRQGHRPIALVGGGTGLIGDPSGKTEMRQMMTEEQVEQCAESLKGQLARFLSFANDAAIMANNAEWLKKLHYIPFLRDIGRHFSVNRMIRMDSCKSRMESEDGLSFIEFNYMVLQAYDFMELYDRYECRIQMGGSDQWGNIVSGIDLIRRMRGVTAFGITFPLITTSSGAKMGKTAKGAVWLDAQRTTPYEYYQFWINTDDRDVARFLSLFTLLPMDEIRAIERLEGADLNNAKAILAFEATALLHGVDESLKAFNAAGEMFGRRHIPVYLLPSSSLHQQATGDQIDSVPTSESSREDFQSGIPAFKLLLSVGLAGSGAEARRLVAQGGAYLNGRRLESFDELITCKDIQDNSLLLRAGKKKYHKIVIKTEKGIDSQS